MTTREQSLEGLRIKRRRLGGLSTFRLTISFLVAGLVIAAVGYTAYGRIMSKPVAAPAQTATVQRGSIMATVASTGSVVADRKAQLSFQTSGRVQEVSVKVGD